MDYAKTLEGKSRKYLSQGGGPTDCTTLVNVCGSLSVVPPTR